MKKTLLAAAVIGTLGMGAFGASQAFAAEDATGTKPVDRLVTAISTKFNLDPTEVQQVFETERAAIRAEHEANFEESFDGRLAEAVGAGKLTQAQSDAIDAKQDEMKAFRSSLADMTPEEREAAMKEHMAELKEWAKENDIPEQFLHVGLKVMKHKGQHFGQIMPEFLEHGPFGDRGEHNGNE